MKVKIRKGTCLRKLIRLILVGRQRHDGYKTRAALQAAIAVLKNSKKKLRACEINSVNSPRLF